MSSQTHAMFAPFIKGEIHPTKHDLAQRYVHQWVRRTGEFASLAWSDDQICDAIEDDYCRDTGFTHMLNRVLEVLSGDRRLPV